MKYFNTFDSSDTEMVKEALKIPSLKNLANKFSVEGRVKNEYANLLNKLPGVKDGQKLVDDYVQPVRETLKRTDMKQKGNWKDKILTKATGTSSLERNLAKGVNNVEKSYATAFNQEARHLIDNAGEIAASPKKLWESAKMVAHGGRGNYNARKFIKDQKGTKGSFLGTNKRKAKKLKKGVTFNSVSSGLDDIIKKDRTTQVKGLAGGAAVGTVGTGAWAVNRNNKEREAKRELIRQMMARQQAMAR